MIDKNELKEILQENLKVWIKHDSETFYTAETITVQIYFQNELLCEGNTYVFR